MTVITVKVSNEERTLKEKHLVHSGADSKESYYRQAPGLESLVEEAIATFNGPVDDITVIINIPW